MNYDKIILELLNRVQCLEEQMAELKAEPLTDNDCFRKDASPRDSVIEYTRTQARDKAIEIIQSKYPDYIVTKASKEEGNGIKVMKPNSKEPILIKFSHSKCFPHRSENFEHGWHVVRLNDVTAINLFIFSLADSEGNLNFFIYTPDALAMYYDEYRSSENEILHLYFVVKEGKAQEAKENTIDVSNHLNNWDILMYLM